MDKKIGFLLICLGLVSLLAVASGVWTHFSAQTEVAAISREQAKLEGQRNKLAADLGSAQKESRHWQEKTRSITASLNDLGRKHTSLQRQFDSLIEETSGLAEKNKELTDELERLNNLYSQAQKQKVAPPEPKADKSDQFLASLLEEKATLQVELDALREGRLSEEEFDNLKDKVEILEKKLEKAQQVSDTLSKNLLQERRKRDALEQELSKTEKQVREILLERDNIYEQMSKMRQALEQRLTEISRAKEMLEGAVQKATQAAKKTELASIELSPIVVRADAKEIKRSRGVDQEIKEAPRMVTKEVPELLGRIITVNQRHKFVVINLGREEGVQKGMTFDVYRRGSKVGKLEAIEIRKNITACDVKEMTGKSLKVNDTIRR